MFIYYNIIVSKYFEFILIYSSKEPYNRFTHHHPKPPQHKLVTTPLLWYIGSSESVYNLIISIEKYPNFLEGSVGFF
jgi:hypothetical protein